MAQHTENPGRPGRGGHAGQPRVVNPAPDPTLEALEDLSSALEETTEAQKVPRRQARGSARGPALGSPWHEILADQQGAPDRAPTSEPALARLSGASGVLRRGAGGGAAGEGVAIRSSPGCSGSPTNGSRACCAGTDPARRPQAPRRARAAFAPLMMSAITSATVGELVDDPDAPGRSADPDLGPAVDQGRLGQTGRWRPWPPGSSVRSLPCFMASPSLSRAGRWCRSACGTRGRWPAPGAAVDDRAGPLEVVHQLGADDPLGGAVDRQW